MNSSFRSVFKNLLTILLLGGLVFWLGHESAERGVFKFTRDEILVAAPKHRSEAPMPAPTPTPLPEHFPATADSGFPDEKDGYLALAQAYRACWPETVMTMPLLDGEITPREAEELFGKIRKREVLEKTEKNERLGLLFDQSVFLNGAAGSAIESEGRWTDLRFRAAARMLHCENASRCECI